MEEQPGAYRREHRVAHGDRHSPRNPNPFEGFEVQAVADAQAGHHRGDEKDPGDRRYRLVVGNEWPGDDKDASGNAASQGVDDDGMQANAVSAHEEASSGPGQRGEEASDLSLDQGSRKRAPQQTRVRSRQAA